MTNNEERLYGLGLYAHFPYCKSKCDYCAFCSSPDLTTADEYFKAMSREILARGDGRRANTVYFGGGTPSFAPRGSITATAAAMREAFDLGGLVEFTVEANPDSVNDAFIDEILSAGANRVSIGLQSASDDLLKKIGRAHSVEGFALAVERLKRAGITNISSDLIIGIDGQDESDVTKAVELWDRLGIAHASVYALTVEDGTPMSREAYRPDPDRQAELYDHAVDELRRYGFERYEVSNFARDGLISLHNYKYWTGADYFGFGAAAHSKIGRSRRENPPSVADYLAGEFITYPLNDEDERVEYLMLSLRTASGLNFDDYERIVGRDLRVEKSTELSELLGLGVIERTADGVRASDKGIYLIDSIITELM